jgi:hypothetical protein
MKNEKGNFHTHRVARCDRYHSDSRFNAATGVKQSERESESY